jgi:hypothetical protein
MDRVIGLVKKFDKIDATKVTNWRLPWNFLCFFMFLVHFMIVWSGSLTFTLHLIKFT